MSTKSNPDNILNVRGVIVSIDHNGEMLVRVSPAHLDDLRLGRVQLKIEYLKSPFDVAKKKLDPYSEDFDNVD